MERSCRGLFWRPCIIIFLEKLTETTINLWRRNIRGVCWERNSWPLEYKSGVQTRQPYCLLEALQRSKYYWNSLDRFSLFAFCFCKDSNTLVLYYSCKRNPWISCWTVIIFVMNYRHIIAADLRNIQIVIQQITGVSSGLTRLSFPTFVIQDKFLCAQVTEIL